MPHGAEGDDERLELAQRDDEAVGKPAQRAATDGNQRPDRECHAEAVRNAGVGEQDRAAADEGGHRADREIKPAGGDHEGSADADHRDERCAGDDIGDVVRGQEAPVQQRADHDEKGEGGEGCERGGIDASQPPAARGHRAHGCKFGGCILRRPARRRRWRAPRSHPRSSHRLPVRPRSGHGASPEPGGTDRSVPASPTRSPPPPCRTRRGLR